ncbi:Membrane protein involved in the export of O-antigen and teichoic acid [Roseovarius litoreus]|uniref:Membrane protein involved in the export of O-antigen and teichoic acid n=1 Tax=Roseovarius litoreus TaxID=1155722 RepID=A0A1M7KWL5_9RHOB|nr:oligosaccharide flippase family protein [Roseovarius litoreus]SHM69951.1 Membrane protein involved in the export of O-antigen and teichoic acid [Roseovarius litoreus]
MAQLLTVLALPVLTRLYSPEEFSVLAVYVAILTMVQVLACLRLEIAIPLPEDEVEAANLLALALVSAIAVAVMTGLLVLGFGRAFFVAIDQPVLPTLSWLLPFGTWLAGSYAALQFWSTRKKRFSTLARTRMVQAGSGLTAQLGLGFASAGPLGLMLGHALMAGAGVVNLARQVWCHDRGALAGITKLGMREALVTYRRFPFYSTWEALANNAAIQFPVLLIAALALGPEAGFIFLATRAIGTPVTLIGGAVGQVYLSRAPEEMRAGRLPEFTADVLKGLVRVGVAPLVFLAVVASPVFAFVFGEEWRRAGELVALMTPWFIFKLLSSPVSMVMHVKMMQRAMLGLMATGLIFRVVITLGAYRFDPTLIAEGYVISGAVFYLVAFWVYLRASGAGWGAVKGCASSFVLPAIAAVLAGLAVRALFAGVSL